MNLQPFVKRLGQLHWVDYDNEMGGTLCGRPCLGTDHSHDIPLEERIPCTECMKVIGFPSHYYMVEELIAAIAKLANLTDGSEEAFEIVSSVMANEGVYRAWKREDHEPVYFFPPMELQHDEFVEVSTEDGLNIGLFRFETIEGLCRKHKVNPYPAARKHIESNGALIWVCEFTGSEDGEIKTIKHGQIVKAENRIFKVEVLLDPVFGRLIKFLPVLATE